MFKTNLKLGYVLALVLGSAIAAIGCGDDSESACAGDEPFPRNGVCGDSGVGGGAGTCNSTNCLSPAICNSLNQCTYNGQPTCGSVVCATGTYCDASTNTCKTPSGSCTITCSTGTVCNNGVCVPGSTGGTCNSTNCPSPSYCSGNTCMSACNSTNCPSPSYCSGNTCVNNGGSGGGDGGTGGTNVTWKPTLSSSTLGWVDSKYMPDGSFTPGQTVNVTSSDGTTTVCAVLYGKNNLLTCQGAKPCEWYNPLKSVLASKHGQNPDNLSYVAGLQGLKDAAADLLACLPGSCSSEFVDRGTANNSSLVDNEAVGDSQSQIACAAIVQ